MYSSLRGIEGFYSCLVYIYLQINHNGGIFLTLDNLFGYLISIRFR